MIDLFFAAVPFLTVAGTVGAVFLSHFHMLPRLQPEVVLVRSPYGFPKEHIETEMGHQTNEQRFTQSPLYHLKYPIRDLPSVERATTEVSKRLSWWRRWFATPWFLLHAPNVEHVSLLETMLTTHGFNVCVLDYPVPTNDGFPTGDYYEWAESCPFVR